MPYLLKKCVSDYFASFKRPCFWFCLLTRPNFSQMNDTTKGDDSCEGQGVMPVLSSSRANAVQGSS